MSVEIKRNIDVGLLVLRIAIGAMMLFHGIAKFKGVSGIHEMIEATGLPGFLAYGVYLTEIVAPILILIGFRTRLASIIYAFGVLFALFLVHLGDIFTLNAHGGWGVELLGLYLFGATALVCTGGGKLAISTSNNWD